MACDVVQFSAAWLAVRMAVDAGSPAEVAANTPAKMLREVGGVKGTVSPSPNAKSHRKRMNEVAPPSHHCRGDASPFTDL